MKNVSVLIALILLLASCRSTRTISKAVTKKDTVTRVEIVDAYKVDTLQLVRTTLQQVEKNYIDFQTFNAKVSVDYQGTSGKRYDFNAAIKIYKDSTIWISANALLGIEAMRLLVTKDSVKMLNKLEKVYSARSVSYLQELTSLPLDLPTLQDLIIGNPVFLDSNVIRYTSGGGVTTLLSLGQFFKNLITLNELDKTIIHSKLDDADPAKNRTATLWYSDYENKNGLPFATKRRLVVSEKDRLEIKLDFKNYSFNEPVAFPFSIPKNYSQN